MKRIIVSIGTLLLTLNGFGWYSLKNSTLDTVYEWANPSIWKSSQPTNFVDDAFYCSTGSGTSATRTYVNPGYTVDFKGLGLGQWAGQTSIVHVAENAYLGVHNGAFAMCANGGEGKSYAELHMTNATIKVYNTNGGTTARGLTFGGGNADGISILDLQQGSVITNGTPGDTTICGAARAYASLNIEDSAIYAPYGTLYVGTSKTADNTNQAVINIRNGRFISAPPGSENPNDGNGINSYGDFSLTLDHSVFSRISGYTRGSDYQFRGYEQNSIVWRILNGSVLNLAGKRGDIMFDTAGRVDILVENSVVTNGGINFSMPSGHTGNGVDPSRIELRGKSVWHSTWQTSGYGEMTTLAPGLEIFLRGGALDVSLGFSEKGARSLVDWTYDTNGCALVRTDSNTGIANSLALHPDGGFQVIQTNAIALIRFRADAAQKGPRGNLPSGGCGTDVGDTGLMVRTPLLKDLFWQGLSGGANIGYAFGEDPGRTLYGVVFKDSAEVALDTAVDARPFGYAMLPAIPADKVASASLRFALEPKGTNTLAGIAARMTAAGYAAEVIDEDGYTIRANVPPALLADGKPDGRVWFDFTTVGGYRDTYAMNVTTNAVVTKVGFQTVKPQTGLILLLR